MKVTPRPYPYQQPAITAAVKGLRGPHHRALVVMATGLGKTLTAAFTAKKMRPRKILFLVHSNHILQHAIEEFRMVFDDKTKIAVFNGMKKKGATEADIVFATWQTMGRHLKPWKRNHFDLIIVDEAHHAEAATYKPVVQYFTGAKLGITATPDREDEADIRSIFGPEVVNISLEEAIARGWLPRLEYHVIRDKSLNEDELQKIAAEIHRSKRRFTMAEVNRRIFIRKRDDEVARIINGYGEKAVVFCASINHAERMKKSLKLSGTFHSSSGNNQADTWKKNQAVLSALKNGTVRRVTAVNAFNEGMNVPSVGLVAFCRVTGVLTIFRQQLGRGLRPGKDKLIVLDFVGNLERIQLVMAMMNRIADLHEQYTSDAERAREGYERKTFEVSGHGFEFTFSDEIVDLMKILEHVEQDFYPTWQEAGKAAVALGLNSTPEYKKGYKSDLRLPASPGDFYRDYPGDPIFFGRTPRVPYPTWQEAAAVARKLGFKTGSQYRGGYKVDDRLPSNPQKVYKKFPGWRAFLRVYYPSWSDSGEAARKLKIRVAREYKDKYKLDAKLPAQPHVHYKDFPGWPIFLGRKGQPFYSTWRQASVVARKLGFSSAKAYYHGYSADERLPSAPERFYQNFPGWPTFLGKKK